MRFGVLNYASAPYSRIVERWRRFESLGFDDAWIADDLNIRGSQDFEAWGLLTALAGEVDRVRMGTLVSTIRLRHPAFLAAQVLTLDHVSGGRAAIALGSGEPYQNATIGNRPWTPRETMERLDEQAAVIKTLLAGRPLHSDGPFYPTHVTEMPMPVTQPRPPITIAAHGPLGIRAAARHADDWNCLGGQPYAGGPKPASSRGGRSLRDAVNETRRLLRLVDDVCTEVGRDPLTLSRSLLAYLPRPDPFGSIGAFDEYVGAYEALGITSMTFYWPPIQEQLEKRAPSTRAEDLFERIATARIGGGR
jgi:alkanesulfonate monooxygenase SsuD/methylene tetrahydromethanopterin reductase-like flavin-dependent oxidoreductase (luciferase family)